MKIVIVTASGEVVELDHEAGKTLVEYAIAAREKYGALVPIARFMEYEIDREKVPRRQIGTIVPLNTKELRLIV